ncbi:AEC family transporter [Phaeobacter italicus]|jgi:predicted permease|uniref:AEC family transporter n=1 Tax=Phaeobacter italicus TaxID=481446 RepID=UPI00018700B1|nr:AEC family transporter [Phaeobacter italicus]EEB72070.1 auxin efflux carrier family protein [Ruegeria sp. R11]MEE2816469.1 AEC family transporter [Pseudomonadota bacterium]NKX71179.1 AEC family transporter [Rhodobacteraceae bacterium R_SAG1]MBO9441799.1 AEC family transporter [Phaeobacter italicus]MBY5976477.1 AEC family transporter [Phaeobacter italicus]
MFQSLIDVILPVFLVIGAGYLATRRGYFQAGHVDALMKFTQSFAIPCLLFRAIATLDLSASFDPRLLISFYTGAAICFSLGMIGARLIFRRDWEDCVAIGFCCLFSNSVLLGLPITERAYGADNLTGNYAIIAFHSPFCYGLGITVMEIVRNKGAGGIATVKSVFSAMFKNVLILGIALGFVANLSGLWIPQAVDEALSLVIRAALPTALFALGGVLVQYRPEGDLRAIGFVCAISLMVHPALVWSMGTALKVQPDLFRSAVLNAAMAPGFNAYIFANMYGRAKRVAASSVLIATGSCILTVWLWLLILG